MTDQTQPPRPPAAYWWCQVGGWGGILLVNISTSQGFVTPSWRLASGYVVLSVFGILLTHGFRAYLLRHGWIDLPIRRLLPRVVTTNFLLAIILVAIVVLYFVAVPPSGHAYTARTRVAVVATLAIFIFNDFIILTLWSGIYFGVAFSQRQRRMEIERYQAQTALAEAELRGLKSQLNPHFFFNCLNSLRALVVENPVRAQEAITQLAAILRYHLQSGERALVPLAEELETVEQYLALELIRFEDRLTIERVLDPCALPFLVPPLALQTLVENAIKYGVSRDVGEGAIHLSARLTGRTGHPERSAAESKDPAELPGSVIYSERFPETPRDPSTSPPAALGMTERSVLEISVRNTGSLYAASGQSTGLGLTNLRTRLRLLFGARASCELREAEPGWVEARLILPVETGVAAVTPFGGTSFRSPDVSSSLRS